MKQSIRRFNWLATLAVLTCSILTATGFAQSLPVWHGSFMDAQGVGGDAQYQFIMVGADPSQSNTTTAVQVDLIPVAVTFDVTDNSQVCGSGPVTFDAYKTKLWNGDSLMDNVVNSPLFTPISSFQEATDGPSEYIDAFQRGNFWADIATHPQYHCN